MSTLIGRPAARAAVRRGALALIGIALLEGCSVGSGEGWVIGDLSLAQCSGEEALQTKEFDLGVDFFAGEALQDPNPAVSQRRNRLTLRLQNTSNNMEVADGLMLQFGDVEQAARRFAAGELLPVTANGLCAGGCPVAEDLLRARLYLYSRCPDARQYLAGTNRTLTAKTIGAGQTCQVPSLTETDGCAVPTAEARASLDAICAGSFSDRSSAELLRSTVGGSGACLYLCSFGAVQRGQDPASLAGFAIDYGEPVAGLFSVQIVDGRAIETAGCLAGQGRVQGMFKFDVARGRAGQTFP